MSDAATLASDRVDGPDRANNFALVRLILSSLVVIGHSYPLTGNVADEPLTRWLANPSVGWGTLAVNSFFAVSGFLVAKSWATSRSTGEFAIKRMLRIYPGLLVAFAVSLVVGSVGSPQASAYLRNVAQQSSRALLLLFADAGIVEQEPAFSDCPNRAVNIPLWTLPIEVQCYATVLAFGLLGLAGSRRAVAGYFGLLFGVYFASIAMDAPPSNHEPLRLHVHFAAGMLALHLAPRPTPVRTTALLALAFLLACVAAPKLYALFSPLLWTPLILAICRLPTAPLHSILNRVDLSYGVFLYGYPVQQIYVKFAGVRDSWTLTALALPTALALAYVSWTLVERPAMRQRERLTRLLLANKTG